MFSWAHSTKLSEDFFAYSQFWCRFFLALACCRHWSFNKVLVATIVPFALFCVVAPICSFVPGPRCFSLRVRSLLGCSCSSFWTPPPQTPWPSMKIQSFSISRTIHRSYANQILHQSLQLSISLTVSAFCLTALWFPRKLWIFWHP